MRTTFQTRGPDRSVDGFCKKDHHPSVLLFTGNPAVQFACSKWNRYDGIC
jgi:hypothetical protein